MKPDIAVTGLAWTTPLGDDLDEVWSRLLAGETALRPVASAHRLRNDLAATVPGAPDPAQRLHEFTVGTVRRALEDAGLEPADPRVLLVAGTSYGSHLDAPDPADLGDWAESAAAELGLARAPVSVATACSSGSDALLIGLQLIRSGVADICVCGGADVVSEAKRLGHSALGTMSPTALRSFDEAADGTLLGEGAGMLVLESTDSARARGATIKAILRGAGSANDAAGMTAPDPTGDSVVLAVQRALADAGLRPAEIGVVNAHGSGTPVNDSVESVSLRRLFGSEGPVVFATKPALGHSLGATGAIEAIAVIQALRSASAAPIAGLANIRPELTLPVAREKPMSVPGRAGLSLTLGFGGFNTAVVLGAAP